MRSNIGYIDKTLRILAVIIICIVVFTKILIGYTAIGLFILAIFLTSSSIKGSCPVYRLLGINTKRNLNDKAMIHERNQHLLTNYKSNYKEMFSEQDKEKH